MSLVYLGLGSNLDDPVAQIDRAISLIEALDSTSVVKISSLYQNPPMGPQDQPSFVNAVILIETDYLPLDLLAALKNIESNMGRMKTRVWGPRVIDCDILLYDNLILNLDDEKLGNLAIPHPGILERPFVLIPLYEIAPNLMLPQGMSLASIPFSDDSMVKLVKEEA